ncbi:ATP-binding protein [Roseateles asaccharophilus]|uniref:histidine kinase n=1 Tax=Roseateles asaccharophilus TaxID=582607 RepID=A0ABU2A5E4_9BURK|nr:ATP-binding protein [Roseateles asaccharophilus]MDR7331278.1 signal transduction histidine kinase [Roseateles asaccharophilus]
MPVTLRSRLLMLVLSVLLPGLLGLAWVIFSTYEAERNAHEANLRDTTRALSQLVDGELARRGTIAQVLAQLPELDGPLDPERRLAFERQARRLLQGMGGWVELRAPGRVLISTRLPEGSLTEGPAPVGLSAVSAVQPLATVSSTSREMYAAWVEPVQRNGQLTYNVAVTVRPEELQRIVQTDTDPGAIGSVLDSAGLVVARQPGGASYVGREVRSDLRRHMAAASEGLFEADSLDAQPTTGYFKTSSLGWTYVAAMPRETFAGRLPSEVVRIVAGALALLALAVAGALWVARRIEQPLLMLKAAAEDMQAGRTLPVQDTGMAESDEVAAALVSASQRMAQSRGELEQGIAQAVERTRAIEQRGAQSQRVEALGRLTGGVAHEFNNLLGVISNSVHLMQRHPAAADLQTPLAATQRAVDKGSQLTQHLLRFAGRRPVRVQVLSFAHYLPEVQALMRSVLGRGIEIRLDVAPDVRPVLVNSGELELALVNLALNAHDAMPEGGELRLSARNATEADRQGLPQLSPGDYVLLAVCDEGVGLAPELVEHAFEPFFTTKAVGQGSGLGLSQVHGFATQAGGTATLASTPGVGTTVSLLLPVAQDTPATARPTSGEPPSSIAGATVMLVEDDEGLGDVTAALLAGQGARVLRASRAEAALRLLDAGAIPDIVLSDIVMPGALDGVALARRLREQRPGLPVVLITGYSNAVMTEGEFVVLRKPCPPAELLAALQITLARARRMPL